MNISRGDFNINSPLFLHCCKHSLLPCILFIIYLEVRTFGFFYFIRSSFFNDLIHSIIFRSFKKIYFVRKLSFNFHLFFSFFFTKRQFSISPNDISRSSIISIFFTIVHKNFVRCPFLNTLCTESINALDFEISFFN